MVEPQGILRQANEIVSSADVLVRNRQNEIVREAFRLLKIARFHEAQMIVASWESRIASFSRKATSPQEHQNFWSGEAKRLREQQGIDLEGLEKLYNSYVSRKAPINPKTGQPHTPETAIRDWASGVLPFMQEVLPDATQQRLFKDISPHNKGVDDVLHDLYRDDDSLDRLTAGLVALHSRANGNITLYNKVNGLEHSRRIRQDMQKQFGRGMGVRPDGSFGEKPVFMGNGQRPDGSFGPKYVYEGTLEDGTRGKKWHYPEAEITPTQQDSLLRPQSPTLQPPGLGPQSPNLQPPSSDMRGGQQPFQTTPRPTNMPGQR